jgi:hypothetical protein
LSEKIGNHKHRAMLQEILDVIGTLSWNKTADFKVRRGRRRKHATVEVQQPLKVISASRWERMHYPEAWKQYFRLEAMRHKRLWHPTYVFSHRGLFELKVEPQIITAVRIPDPEVETRLSEIKEWIRDRHLGPRLDGLLGIGKWRWKGSERKGQKLAKLQFQEMREALNIFPEVDPMSFAMRHRISLHIIFFPA